MSAWEFIKQLTNPESIIHFGGVFLLTAVIFMENGLIIGFFLPGDSLIFLSGLLCATKPELLGLEIFPLIVCMYVAAFSGSFFGFFFGRRVGKSILNRQDSVIFKKKYIDITQSFYERYGGKTLVLGRFLPIIRTFAPILAGVIRVDLKIFTLYNLIGGALWISSLSLIGYFLGARVPGISDYVEHIVVLFIAVTTILLIRTYIKEKKKARQKATESSAEN
jgi:membrane-associated protein